MCLLHLFFQIRNVIHAFLKENKQEQLESPTFLCVFAFLSDKQLISIHSGTGSKAEIRMFLLWWTMLIWSTESLDYSMCPFKRSSIFHHARNSHLRLKMLILSFSEMIRSQLSSAPVQQFESEMQHSTARWRYQLSSICTIFSLICVKYRVFFSFQEQ